MNEKEKRENGKRVVVNVPVTATILVPISIDCKIPDDQMIKSDTMGVCIVDPTENIDALGETIELALTSKRVSDAISTLMTALIRHKESDINAEMYLTPFAGVVEENKI